MGTIAEQFRALFGSSQLPICLYDSQTLRILAVSDSAIARYGYGREEFLRMCITELRPAEDVDGLKQLLEERTHGLRKSGALRHRFKDGSITDVRVTSLAMNLDGRDVILAIAEDVTGDEEASAVLKESEERFRSAFEHAVVGMLMTALDGRLMRANASFAEMLGYTEVELLKLNFADLTDPQDQKRSVAGAKDLIAGKIRSFDIEKRYRRKDSTIVWVRLTAALIRDSENRPLHFVTLAENISNRKAAEQEIEKRSAYLDALFQNSPLAIVATTFDDRVQMCNPAFSQMFQYGSEEIAGQVLFSLITPEEFRDGAQEARRRVRNGETVHSVSRRRRKDGTIVDVELRAVPLVVGSGVVGMYVLYEDITERLRIESQMREARDNAEAANRAKSEFLANMSHEIRTPLNGVMGMVDLALDTPLSDEAREYLATAKTSADSLLEVINDILDFSKIEAGKFDLDSIPFDLREILAQVVQSFRYHTTQKGLKLEVAIDSSLPEQLLGDPGRVRQVLINLLGNALKFTAEGAIQVNVDCQPRGPDRMLLHFAVVDTGIGIPQAKQGAIFEAFAQADGSTTRRFGGTGLGLSISSRLVRMMGGKIWVESEPGRGSTFHFTALLASATSAQPFGQQRQKPTPSQIAAGKSDEPETERKLCILLTEDNPVNQQLTSRLLQKRGHSVTIAPSGRAALAALERQSFDLVLMDVQMPEMDGFETTAAIRQREKGTDRHVPVVAMTAHALQGYRERCLQAGMDGYLSKPVKPSDLYTTIQAATSPELVPQAD